MAVGQGALRCCFFLVQPRKTSGRMGLQSWASQHILKTLGWWNSLGKLTGMGQAQLLHPVPVFHHPQHKPPPAADPSPAVALVLWDWIFSQLKQIYLEAWGCSDFLGAAWQVSRHPLQVKYLQQSLDLVSKSILMHGFVGRGNGIFWCHLLWVRKIHGIITAAEHECVILHVLSFFFFFFK